MPLQKPKLLSRKLLLVLLVFFVFLGCFANDKSVEAAKPDRIAPTTPTNLHATNITDTSISLAWNQSTDNIGVTGYDIYQDNRYIGNVTSTQYVAKNLTPNSSYRFYQSEGCTRKSFEC